VKKLSFIQWFGGKGMLLKFLKQYIPPHRFYGELFGGGAALLLNKEPAEREYYNDLDERLWRLFTAVKEDKQFQAKADLLLHSRRLFKRWRYESTDPFGIFYTGKSSFSGFYGSAWTSAVGAKSRGLSASASAFLSAVRRLDDIHQRLRDVIVTRLDWRQWIEKYNPDFEDWFLYLDPPYVGATRRSGGYKHEMTDSDHEEIIEFCLSAKCHIMLSGYDNKIYRRLEEAGWRKVVREMPCHAAAKTRATGLQGSGVCSRKIRSALNAFG